MKKSYKSDILEYIHLLKKGVDFEFAVPVPSISRLFNRLKEAGFIDEGTTEGCFKVIFGIPINRKKEDFEKVVWKRDLQLLRYFLFRIIKLESWKINSIAFYVFRSKSNTLVHLPKSDKKRLENASGIDLLKDIIDEYLGENEGKTLNGGNF